MYEQVKIFLIILMLIVGFLINENLLADSGPKSKDKVKLEKAGKVLAQLDSIHREAWWVLTGEERKAVGVSVFGKLQRAVQSGLNIKIRRTWGNSCEKYKINFKNNYLELFEHCRTKENPVPIGKIIFMESNFTFEFELNNLVDINGIGASILTRKISCSSKINKNDIVDYFSCKDFTQSKSDAQVIRLEKYEYFREQSNLIDMKGKVYENLQPQRSIEVKVPLSGKIIVNEILLNPPRPAVKPPAAPIVKKVKPKEKKDPNIEHGLETHEITQDSELQNQNQNQNQGHQASPHDMPPSAEPHVDQQPPADLPVPDYQR